MQQDIWIDKIEDKNKLLVLPAQSGDCIALNKLYINNKNYIEGIYATKIYDNDTIQDLTQKSLIKIFLALPTYKYNNKFTTFVYEIAMNVYRDYWRRINSELNKSIIPLEDQDSEVEAYEEKMMKDERYDSVINKINSFKNEEMKYVFIQKFINEKSNQEITDSLGITEGKMRKLIFDGRKILERN